MASEDYTYSDGYSTLSERNSTGSIIVNGTYFDDDKKPKPKSNPIPTFTTKGVQSTQSVGDKVLKVR